jgi:hypothetical protein
MKTPDYDPMDSGIDDDEQASRPQPRQGENEEGRRERGESAAWRPLRFYFPWYEYTR